jgi:hypothetical protein
MKINEFIIEMEFEIYKQEIFYILYNLLASSIKTAKNIDIIFHNILWINAYVFENRYKKVSKYFMK